MAIMTEFLSLIVPIAVIEEKYPGGWDRCLKDHQVAIGGRVWFDDYLFRDGAMNPIAMGQLLNQWWKLGFECYAEKEGKRYWKDVCVYEGTLEAAPMHCDWLAEDLASQSVYLKGHAMGEVKGRDWDLIDDWEELKFPGI